MRRGLMGCGVLLILGAASAGWAAPGGERARVELLLSARHELPALALFEAAAADPAAIVRGIAAEPKSHPAHRRAALVALQHWPDAASRRIYADLLQNPEAEVALRHRALLLASRVFGAEALSLVAPALSSPDPQLRRTAAEALWRLPGPGVDKLLEDTLAREPAGDLRAVLTRMLARRRWLGGALR